MAHYSNAVRLKASMSKYKILWKFRKDDEFVDCPQEYKTLSSVILQIAPLMLKASRIQVVETRVDGTTMVVIDTTIEHTGWEI